MVWIDWNTVYTPWYGGRTKEWYREYCKRNVWENGHGSWQWVDFRTVHRSGSVYWRNCLPSKRPGRPMIRLEAQKTSKSNFWKWILRLKNQILRNIYCHNAMRSQLTLDTKCFTFPALSIVIAETLFLVVPFILWSLLWLEFNFELDCCFVGLLLQSSR